MKAAITWAEGEPPSTCKVEVRGHGATRATLRAPATKYMLEFDGRWYRIYRGSASREARHVGGFYVKLKGARYPLVMA